MQIQDNGQIQPTFTRPNIGDVTFPLLVWLACKEVSVQQVWRNIELVVTVRRRLMFTRSDDSYTVLAHPLTGS